jgi:hypothetical protein
MFVLGVALTACAGPAPTNSPAPTASPTPPVSSTVPPEPSASPAEFGCQLPVHVASSSAEQTHLTDIRIAGHDGYDRLVFEFDRGLPEIDLRKGIPPFTTDPAGLPLIMDGVAFLQITFRGASRGGSDGPVTYEGPTDFSPGLHELVMVRMAGDFEGVLTFIVGLDAPPCFDLFTLESPSRVVLDVAGQ